MELEEGIEFIFNYNAIESMITEYSDVTDIKDWDGEKVRIKKLGLITLVLSNLEREVEWWVDRDYIEKMIHENISSKNITWR